MARCMTLPSYETTMKHAITVLTATFPKATVKLVQQPTGNAIAHAYVTFGANPLDRDRYVITCSYDDRTLTVDTGGADDITFETLDDITGWVGLMRARYLPYIEDHVVAWLGEPHKLSLPGTVKLCWKYGWGSLKLVDEPDHFVLHPDSLGFATDQGAFSIRVHRPGCLDAPCVIRPVTDGCASIANRIENEVKTLLRNIEQSSITQQYDALWGGAPTLNPEGKTKITREMQQAIQQVAAEQATVRQRWHQTFSAMSNVGEAMGKMGKAMGNVAKGLQGVSSNVLIGPDGEPLQLKAKKVRFKNETYGIVNEPAKPCRACQAPTRPYRLAHGICLDCWRRMKSSNR